MNPAQLFPRFLLRPACPWAAVALLALTGCSNRPETAPVVGSVTLAGKPLEEGRIMFYPDEGRPAVGAVENGRYELTTFDSGDGAVLGTHRVTVTATKVGADAQMPASFEEELAGKAPVPAKYNVQWLVPEAYSRRESTPLSAEVEPGKNVLDFEITP